MALEFKNYLFVETPKFAEALAFYKDQIGLKVKSQHESWAELQLGSGTFVIASGADPIGPVVEYETDEQQADKERLLRAGCVLIRENSRGDQCYLRDPFGF